MSNEPYEEFEHNGVSIRIYTEEYAENPRDVFDHVGHIVWLTDHNTRDYDLKDEKVGLAREDLTISCPACKGHGEFANERLCEKCDGDGEVPTDDIVAWAKEQYDAHIVIPLHFEDRRYDGSVTLDDADNANGFLYVTRAEIISEWGQRGNLTGQATKRARKYLGHEVEEYDAYAQGEVFYWVAELDGDTESVGGYYGDLDYVREEAKRGADELLARVERENTERQFWLERGVMTVG